MEHCLDYTVHGTFKHKCKQKYVNRDNTSTSVVVLALSQFTQTCTYVCVVHVNKPQGKLHPPVSQQKER